MLKMVVIGRNSEQIYNFLSVAEEMENSIPKYNHKQNFYSFGNSFIKKFLFLFKFNQKSMEVDNKLEFKQWKRNLFSLHNALKAFIVKVISSYVTFNRGSRNNIKENIENVYMVIHIF